MLKPKEKIKKCKFLIQPPSGGCVLKRDVWCELRKGGFQPPSGGCVLKLLRYACIAGINNQPPSGGCVLKHVLTFLQHVKLTPSRLQAAVC